MKWLEDGILTYIKKNEGRNLDSVDIVSHSLAMHPDQIKEHKQRFPDIKVTDDGCPVFTNTQAHDKYLKAIGWKKVPGRKRRRSKKLPCGSGNHK